jgi:hypothetical protein
VTSLGPSLYAPPLGVRYGASRSRNQCCRGKAVRITYSKCVFVALIIQHEIRMRRIVLSVACLAVPYFPTLSHKRHDFLKDFTNTKCVLFSLQLLSETFLVLRRTRRDRIINVYGSSCKVPVILHVKYPLFFV